MKQRIITGVVGIIVAALVINMGGAVFAAAATILALIAWKEYAAAFLNIDLHVSPKLGFLLVAALLGATYFCGLPGIVGTVMLGTLLLLLGSVFSFEKTGFQGAGISVAGFVYIGLAFSHLIMLRFFAPEIQIETIFGNFTRGEAFIWLMFIGTWASDSFAYFAGKAVGTTKLSEDISPNKTIEGFIGGLIGTTVVIFVIGHFFFGFHLYFMPLLGVILAIFGALGDLVESALKRHTGIKDSGNLIPGHGGVLDRFDSVLFNAPIVYYFALGFGL